MRVGSNALFGGLSDLSQIFFEPYQPRVHGEPPHQAGCPGRIPHDLRRTAVRNLVRAGVPQTVAMKLTGHKADSVFRRYDIVSPDDLRVAVERLDAAVGAPARHQDNQSTGWGRLRTVPV